MQSTISMLWLYVFVVLLLGMLLIHDTRGSPVALDMNGEVETSPSTVADVVFMRFAIGQPEALKQSTAVLY